MATIAAQITEDARRYLPQMWGGLLPMKTLNYFKVGEGGWIDIGAGHQQRTPVADLRRVDNSLQDIDAIVDATRIAADQRYATTERATFTKAIALSDMSFVSPSKLEVRCLLTETEFNDDGYGNSPEIWEIGLFSDHPVFAGQLLLVAYGTLTTGQVKTSSSPLMNIVRIVA